MKDVLTLKGIYSVMVVILEIPSGYLADVWGKRKTLILGTIMGSLGYVIYSLSYEFWGFLFAELILGIGGSFISGSDSAVLYDSLALSNKSDKYLKIEGRITSIGNFAEAFAGIIGGYLALMSLRTPFVFQSFIAFIGVPAAFLLREPQINKKFTKYNFSNVIYALKYSMLENKELKWNIVYSSVIGCATLTMAWFLQPFLKQFSVSLDIYGYVWASLNIVVAFVSFQSYKFERKFKQKKTIIFILLGISLGYILTVLFDSLWGLIFVYMFYAVRGVATPVLKDYINRCTESNVRSTVLSIRNFIIRLFFAAIGPFLGWFNDMYSLKHAFILSGCIFFVLGLFSVFFIIRYIKK